MAAPSWDHGGWRREDGLDAQRLELELHIEEVEAYLAGYKAQGAAEQSAERYGITEYRKDLEVQLAKLKDALGTTVRSASPQFVGMVPRRD